MRSSVHRTIALSAAACCLIAVPASGQRRVYTNQTYDTLSATKTKTAQGSGPKAKAGGAVLVYEFGKLNATGAYEEKFLRFAVHQSSEALARRILANHTSWQSTDFQCQNGKMVGTIPGASSYGQMAGTCQSRVWTRGGYFAYATGFAPGYMGQPWYTNAIGTSVGLATREAAEQQALRNCQADGGMNCALQSSMVIGLKQPISDLIFQNNGVMTPDMFGLDTKNCDIYGQRCWISNQR